MDNYVVDQIVAAKNARISELETENEVLRQENALLTDTPDLGKATQTYRCHPALESRIAALEDNIQDQLKVNQSLIDNMTNLLQAMEKLNSRIHNMEHEILRGKNT
jgi:DNA repair exonuclease SbcCD ATPase subunit